MTVPNLMLKVHGRELLTSGNMRSIMEITSMRTMKTTKQIKDLLNQYNLRPLKKLGQNFLVSKQSVDKVIAAADLKANNIVLEVGPGLGALTFEIAKKTKQVIAVEKDKGLANVLRKALKKQKINNVKIINSDILGTVRGQSRDRHMTVPKYKVIANLPYNIATAVIMKFLEAKNPPQVMAVMMQKEVGKRLCEAPPNMSRLAVFAQFYSTPKIISYVSKKNFYPQPKVDSVILEITPKNNNLSIIDKKLFAKIVKAGFTSPRKQLVNNFSKSLNIPKQQAAQWLTKNKISPAQRAETLTVNNFINLTKTFNNSR